MEVSYRIHKMDDEKAMIQLANPEMREERARPMLL